MTNSKRHRRRIRLFQTQLTLSTIARRDAIVALADVVGEGTRSAQLAKRTRDIIRSYAVRQHKPTGYEFRENAAFVRGLQEICGQASQAQDDADEQANWQAQALSAADTRNARIEERLLEEQRNLQASVANRDLASQERLHNGLARKLQSVKRNRSRASGDSL